MLNAYLYEGLRTPFGRHGGTQAKVRPDDLLADAIRNVMKKSPFKPEQIEDIERRLQQGMFDLIALGRAILANPDWVQLVQAGHADQLRQFSKAQLEELW